MPLLLLHGWPGFWFDWRDCIGPLADRGRVIVPDLRGFGRSDRPSLPPAQGYGPNSHVEDMLALLDSLEIPEAVVVGHDIGMTIAQEVARSASHRVRALVLCNPIYPGVGSRRFEPAAQREFWYSAFHNTELCESLMSDERNVRIYLEYLYRYWSARHERLQSEDLDAIIETYSQPGAFAASIQYYRARARAESAAAPGTISVPTQVLWGDRDPVIPSRWADRLDETFTDFELRILPGVGHFVPWEAPEAVVGAVDQTLGKLGSP